MTRYEPTFWECGEEHDDDVRKLVDENVRDALTEYFEDSGRLYIDYRIGGAPIILFEICTDDGKQVARVCRDLGDKLLEELQNYKEAGPEEMANLFTLLLDAYERWRLHRTSTDSASNIPTPMLVDGEAIERDGIDEAIAPLATRGDR